MQEVTALNIVVVDLEGPVSHQDNALAVCQRYVPGGDQLFPLLSRYNYLRVRAGEEGSEPGDTLRLLLPFLIEAKVTEDDIRAVSAEAGLVSGIREFFGELQDNSCLGWIISTSYVQHAHMIAERVGIPLSRVDSTFLPLDEIRERCGDEATALIRRVRERVVSLRCDAVESGVLDGELRQLLDPFFSEELPLTEFRQAMSDMVVIGGRRKVWALEHALQKCNGRVQLEQALVIGDSITDSRMLQVVEAAGGVAVAWNANQYAIPWATCGVAAVDARATQPLIDAWVQGGRIAVRSFVESASLPSDSESGPFYHWLSGTDQEFQEGVVFPVHKRLRTLCRGAEVAKLG